MTPKLWIYAGVFLFAFGMFMHLQFVESQLESARDTIKDYKQKSETAKKEYKNNLKVYTQKVVELDSKLRDELENINNFKEDANATKCENAIRFFNTFEY